MSMFNWFGRKHSIRPDLRVVKNMGPGQQWVGYMPALETKFRIFTITGASDSIPGFFYMVDESGIPRHLPSWGRAGVIEWLCPFTGQTHDQLLKLITPPATLRTAAEKRKEINARIKEREGIVSKKKDKPNGPPT